MALASVSRGEYYSQHSQVQEKWYASLFSDLRFRGNESVLDIGSGDGRLTAGYAVRVPRGKVLGIDASEEMVAWANQRYAAQSNLSFRKESALTFRFIGAFDWIFSSNCLHWVPDHRRVLKNIVRALKPKGRFTLLFCAVDNPFHPINGAIDETVFSDRWKKYFVSFKRTSCTFRKERYLKWAMESKIPHFTISEIFTNDDFEDLHAFSAWIIGWLPHLDRLPPSLHSLFAEEVAFRYLQNEEALDEVGHVRFIQKLCLLKGALS